MPLEASMSPDLDAVNPDAAIFWLRVGTGVLCGALIGVERQLRGKPAGIRTSILICLGTQVFVAMGVALAGPHADPTRVLGQVVTGIGFLGGGVILAREGLVIGVTSAAVIWMLAAIGCLIGLGHLDAALILTGVTIAILIGVEAFESLLTRLNRGKVARQLEEIELDQ
jgi:putative Mg2+ transporter-C (MgtC) family protein